MYIRSRNMPVSISHWFYIMVVALGITSHLVSIVILTLRSKLLRDTVYRWIHKLPLGNCIDLINLTAVDD